MIAKINWRYMLQMDRFDIKARVPHIEARPLCYEPPGGRAQFRAQPSLLLLRSAMAVLLLLILAGSMGDKALAQDGNINIAQATLASAQHIEWQDQFDAKLDMQGRPNSTLPILASNSLAMLEAAIERQRRIVSAGGWPSVRKTSLPLRQGRRHEAVLSLRKRLIISDDLDERAGQSQIFDSYVAAAVRRFQERHGLIASGIVDEPTRAQLNISAAERLLQLTVNLDRARAMSQAMPSDYVMVNIPGAEIVAVDNGAVYSRHGAVVGKIDRQTPILSSNIHELNFHPYWTVPVSIIERDLIPIMQTDSDYLARNNIRIFNMRGKEVRWQDIDWTTDEATKFRFRQEPGRINSLGSVRINFSNAHQVYLHDTPDKSLFGNDSRFHSSGCVRVQNIRALIAWMLSKTTPGWDREKVDQTIRSGARADIKLGRSLPIYLAYFTAWADDDNVIHFRGDVYDHDGLGQMQTTAKAAL